MKRRKRTKTRSRFVSQQSKYLVFTRRKLTWGLIWLIVVGISYALMFGNLLRVKDVLCEKDQGECSEEIVAENNRILDSNILIFKADEHKKKLLNSDPSIEDVIIKTKLPNTIIIRLKTRKPLAMIKTKKSLTTLLVDDRGIIFAKQTEGFDSLPIIETEEIKDLGIGKKTTNHKILKALKLTEIILDNFIQFKKIEIMRKDLMIELSDGTVVLVSPEGDLEKQVSSLQQILYQATIDATIKTIDVRLEKPVIIYE